MSTIPFTPEERDARRSRYSRIVQKADSQPWILQGERISAARDVLRWDATLRVVEEERDYWNNERDEFADEIVALRGELKDVKGEWDTYEVERDAYEAERNAYEVERNAYEAERDALAEELAEVTADRDSWRHCTLHS